MDRDDADRADAGEGSGGHCCAGEQPCRCAPEKPAARKGRAATCVSPCALLLPGQTKGSARQPSGPPPLSAAVGPPGPRPEVTE
jgi:hypothetical protein